MSTVRSLLKHSPNSHFRSHHHACTENIAPKCFHPWLDYSLSTCCSSFPFWPSSPCPTSSVRRGEGHRRHRPPPGPWALPVLGHLHHLVGAAPHHRLRDLSRRHGPLMLLRLGELPVVVVSSAAAAREVFKTHDLAFSTRPIGPATRVLLAEGCEGLAFAPYGDGWRQLRKVYTVELLSAHRVRSFRAVREQEVSRLVGGVAAAAAAGPVNLSRRISSYVADSAVRAIMGSRFEDRAAFFRLLERGLKLFSDPCLPDLYPSSRLAMLISRTPRLMKRYRMDMMAFMEGIIQEHRTRRADDDVEEDLVDVLLRIQRDDSELQLPISMDNIKAVLADLFIAGSDSSATTLQWVMSELMRNPRVMKKLQDEVRRVLNGQERVTEASLSNLHYLQLVLKETLRVHTPAPLLVPRECRNPCQILGFGIPVGATVIVNAWAIARDPMHWDTPDEFVPERFEHNNIDFKGTNFEYIPFGAGRRMCPGVAFGLANVELALASLLYHFDWELPNGMEAVDIDMTEVTGFTARRRDDLLLVPVVRVPV